MSQNRRGSELEKARDRLFSEMHRCGVCDASEEDIDEWLSDAVRELSTQYPALTRLQLEVLRRQGQNFAAPVVPHGQGNDARRL